MLIDQSDTERKEECAQLNKEIDQFYTAEIVRVGRQIGFNIDNGMDTHGWTNPDDLWSLWDALVKSREEPITATRLKFPARWARLKKTHPEIFGSELGMHLFRIRRIELLDNPLAVAPDDKVFSEQSLHWTDEDFYKSSEYLVYKREVEGNRHSIIESDIYTPDDARVRQTCEPYLDVIRQLDLAEILSAYEWNKMEGDECFSQRLVEVLGIKNPPCLSYAVKKPDRTTRGKYFSKSNTVRIYTSNTPDHISQRIGTLAHEMWHAYQKMQASYRNGRNRLYKYNYDHYIDSDEDYIKYCAQLIEREAFYFGGSVSQIIMNRIVK